LFINQQSGGDGVSPIDLSTKPGEAQQELQGEQQRAKGMPTFPNTATNTLRKGVTIGMTAAGSLDIMKLIA
jgi:hypothetical protein